MPNARDIDVKLLGRPRILAIGMAGSGKTSQITTLPGKTFAYFFDPAALSSVKGYDIEYETFFPTVANMGATPVAKKSQKDKKTFFADAGQVYLNWEKDFEQKLQDGFFDTYDNLCFDSLTTFADIVMDRHLELNGRAGQWPQQDDYPGQMNTVRNVFRTLTGQKGLTIFCTGHDNTIQDEVTSRIFNQIMVTGQLRVKLPLMFSDMLHLECRSTATEIKYTVQTRPDRMNPSVRCNLKDTEGKDLDMFHDVTISNWAKPGDYGIGKLLKDGGYYKNQA